MHWESYKGGLNRETCVYALSLIVHINKIFVQKLHVGRSRPLSKPSLNKNAAFAMLRQVVSNAYIKSFLGRYNLATALPSIKSRHPPLDDEGPVLFAVEGTLVLQPAPVVLDTRDLLTVVVRDRVLRAARRRVGTVSLNACVEALLFL
jgi:hypothetical protein